MKRLAVISLLLAASPALAQQPPPPDPQIRLVREFDAIQTLQTSLAESINRVIADRDAERAKAAELQKTLDAERAYWKAYVQALGASP